MKQTPLFVIVVLLDMEIVAAQGSSPPKRWFPMDSFALIIIAAIVAILLMVCFCQFKTWRQEISERNSSGMEQLVAEEFALERVPHATVIENFSGTNLHVASRV